MNLNKLSFSLSAIARMSGAKADSIQNWTKGNKIVGKKEIGGGDGKGSHRRYSFQNVMEIAIADRLLKFGFKGVDRAFKAANVFSHTGRGEVAGRHVNRTPSFPYHQNLGQTYLYLSADDVHILCDDGGVTQSEIQGNLLSSQCYIVVNASTVFDEVVAALDIYETHEILDEIYPAEAS